MATLVYELDFLDKKGRNFTNKLQQVTRHMAKFLLKANKPMVGINMIARAIRILRQSTEQVSSLHTQYALLCLKAKCL